MLPSYSPFSPRTAWNPERGLVGELVSLLRVSYYLTIEVA